MRRSIKLCALAMLPFLTSPDAANASGHRRHSSSPTIQPGETADTMHGVVVPDPWRALEDGAAPAVKAWSDAQNLRARKWLDAHPARSAIAARIGGLIRATSPQYFALQPRQTATFAMYMDPAVQQPMLITLSPSLDPATRKVLIDPNTLQPRGHVAIDWFQSSPDGSKVAVSLSEGGSEDGTLHVFDATSGKEIEPSIPRVQYPTGGGALVWSGDGAGFWYTRYPGTEVPEAERHFNQQAFWHTLGSDAAADRLVLGKEQGLPRTAEIFLDNSEDGPDALASVQLGDGGQWQHFVLSRDGVARQIGRYDDRVIGGAVIARDGTVYGVSRKDAPMGKVLRLSKPYDGGFAAAEAIIAPQSEAAIIDGGESLSPLLIAGDRLSVNRISGGPSVVTIYLRDGSKAEPLPLPALSAVRELVGLPGGGLLANVTSFVQPPHFERWDARTGPIVPTELAVTSPVNYEDAEVRRIFVTSKDGTKVPVTVIARKGIALDGSHPLLLTGYGGFGINIVPSFSTTRMRLWLDADGVYAVANIRGGGEYGLTWHEQGMLTHKQNVFDDFAAAAQGLIAQGFTRPQRLAMIGGSNGGLLMGAMITQHPELMRAVVAQVGIYDMIRTERDPNGAFNVSEYGSVADPAQFAALRAYSPLLAVRKGTRYPAVLLTTGANDGRVNPYHSRKFAAALQKATAAPYPILLRTSQSSGHGSGSSLDDVIAEGADVLTFLFDQLGMKPNAK